MPALLVKLPSPGKAGDVHLSNDVRLSNVVAGLFFR